MSFFKNLDKHLNQIKKGGIKTIIKKIRTIIFLTLTIPFFIISIPSVIIIRLISPWILIRFGEIESSRIGHFAKELGVVVYIGFRVAIDTAIALRSESRFTSEYRSLVFVCRR